MGWQNRIMEAALRGEFDDVWAALREATHRRTAFTLGHLGTLGLDGIPQVRAVILRRADAGTGTVCFATHARSAKVSELRRDSGAGFTFYDDEAQVQLRLTGRAEIVADRAERAEVWTGLGEHNRALYRDEAVPGSPLNSVPGSPLNGRLRDGAISGTSLVGGRAESSVEPGDEAGFERFAWVRIRVESMDTVHLSTPEHARFRFERSPEGWSGAQVVP